MNNNTKIRGWGGVFILGLAAVQVPAFAEAAKETKRPVLEEVIVTAQKREQNLQDVPIAITALGRATLESHEVNNIQDLTKLVPSLKYNGSFTPVNASIRIRGVGTEVLTASAEPNVSVLVDGVPLARTELVNFQFADLERVEVLRGPQGTLFGKNSTAGVVSVVTRDPAPEFEAFVRASLEKAQDWPGGQRVLKGGVSGPLSDSTGVRVSGFYKEQDGHLVDVINDKELPGGEDYGVRAKIRWEISDDVVARLNAEVVRGDSDPAPFLFGSANPDKQARESSGIVYHDQNRKAKNSGIDRLVSENDSISLAIDWDFDSFTLTSLSGYRKYDLDRRQSVLGLDGSRLDITATLGRRILDTFSQELRMTSTGSDTIEYTVGALWFDHEVYDELFNQAENIPPSVLAAGTGLGGLLEVTGVLPNNVDSIEQTTFNVGEASIQNLGLFAQGTWHINNRWHLTSGARYIVEKQRADSFLNVKVRTTAGGIVVSDTTQDPAESKLRDTHVTAMSSLQFDWTDSSNIYATVSSGYRGGTYDIGATDLDKAFAQPIDPETVTSFELGSKSRLFDDRLEINVAAFHSIFEDFQAQVADVPPPDLANVALAFQYKLANAGGLETTGIELEFKYQALSSLFFSGFFLYNIAEFTEFNAPCFVGQNVGERGGVDENGDGRCDTQDVSGGVLPNAPELSAAISARYEVPFDASNAYVQLSGRWQDDVQFMATQHPLTIQKSYSVWDLRLAWRGLNDRLEVAGYVSNLFNQFYVNGFFPLSVVNDRRDLVHYVPRDANRQFGASISYSF